MPNPLEKRIERIEKIFSISKAEILDKLGLIPPETNRLFQVESRKVQQINGTLYISIPISYCNLMKIEKGQLLKLFWRRGDANNNPLFVKV